MHGIDTTQADQERVRAPGARASAEARQQLQHWGAQIAQLDLSVQRACSTLTGIQTYLGLGAARQLLHGPESSQNLLSTYQHLERVRASLTDLRAGNARYATVLTLMDVAWHCIDSTILQMTQRVVTAHITEVQAMLAHVRDVTDEMPQALI